MLVMQLRLVPNLIMMFMLTVNLIIMSTVILKMNLMMKWTKLTVNLMVKLI